MESHFKISVIGLGLIGGSAAYALHGFKDAEITGFDNNREVLTDAYKKGAIDRIAETSADAVEDADLVIICTYPDSIAAIVRENAAHFKKDAVVCDFCGVKTRISAEITENLPSGVDYVGGHPMAGKEVEGFENAEPRLFENCGFIVTPVETSRKESIDLIFDAAKHIGAAKITVNTPKKHDEIIAYTSDLMHIAAAGLCLDFNDDMNLAYTAGAFRDCTRVALINPAMWTEIFMANAENTLRETERYINSLCRLRDALSKRDKEQLYKLLERTRENKAEILKRVPAEREEVNEKAQS